MLGLTPGRLLAATFAVDGLGTGLWLATSVLFLTRTTPLTAGQVALALSVAGVVGMLGAVPLGRWADRRGLRGVSVGLTLVQGVAIAAHVAATTLPVLIVVASVFLLGQRGGNAVRNALLGVTVGEADRVRVRAVCRSVANIGLSAGALLAIPVLAVDTRSSYVAAVLANAASYGLSALLIARLPPVAGKAKSGRGRLGTALRDRPYLVMTGLVGLLSLHRPVLTVALPLWVASATAAPRSMIGVLLVVNTVLVVVGQVPVSRGAEGLVGGARALRRCGVALLVACLLLGAAGSVGTALSAALLIVGTGVLTLGELWQSAGGWALSYSLADPNAHGEYQGVYALGNGVRDSVGPVTVTGLCLGLGLPGWAILGVGFALVGAAVGPLLNRVAAPT